MILHYLLPLILNLEAKPQLKAEETFYPPSLLRAVETIKDGEIRKKVLSGFSQAYRWTDNAVKKGKSEYNDLRSSFRNSKYQVLSNDDDYCENGTIAARADCPGNTFYICYNQIVSSNRELAETLLHEGAHSTGVCDECEAEYTTQGILKANGLDYLFVGYPNCFK